MQNIIITKLNKHLSYHRFSSEVWSDLSIDMEAWIVYLFVQIRKILEIKKSDKYKILGLYCDWVVHIKLDRNSQAKEVIKQVTKYFNNDLINKEKLEVVEKLNFITLRKELNEFLRGKGLSNDITLSKNGEWFEFRKTLIQILIGQPLELLGQSDSDIIKLMLVEEKNSNLNINDYFIIFEATLKSGEILEERVLVGDYGGERKVRLERERDEFWERVLIKKGYYLNKKP